jgi:hypothetical protein
LGWHCDWVVIGFATFAYHNPHALGGIFFEKSISLGYTEIPWQWWSYRIAVCLKWQPQEISPANS